MNHKLFGIYVYLFEINRRPIMYVSHFDLYIFLVGENLNVEGRGQSECYNIAFENLGMYLMGRKSNF